MLDRRPDWRQAKAYAFPKELDLRYWAWEFLRRNAQYQADWRDVLSEYRALVEKFGVAQVQRKLSLGFSADPEHENFIISSLDLAPKLRGRWGIDGFVNPDQDKPLALSFIRSHEVVAYPGCLAEEFTFKFNLEKHHALVRFDLRFPFGSQLKLAERTLRFLRRDGRVKLVRQRRSKDNWKLYLRLLDARASGASYKAIKSVLFENLGKGADTKKTVEGALRRAKRMTTPAGYLGIL